MSGERGYTLVELLMASAIAALILTSLSAATYQFVTATDSGHERLAVLHDQRNAFRWLHRDAQMAVLADTTVLPDAVTFVWTDEVTGTEYESAYAVSGDDLVRTLSVDGTPASQTVARHLAASGFTVSASDDLLTVTLTSELGDAAGALTETFQMRPVGAGGLLGPMRLATGAYDGDGSDARAITGLGFQPDFVLVKMDGAQAAIIRTGTMTGDAAKDVTSAAALVSNRIESLDADGFTVGSDNDVNRNNRTYYWVAMKAGLDMVLGSYVGDGADGRAITGLALQPMRVLTMGDGSDTYFRPGTIAGDESFNMVNGGSQLNRIQALLADGFQLGDDDDVNQSGATFHYVAWADSAQAAEGSYTGDNQDGRDITGLGFQPQFVWVKREDAGKSVWRPESLTGDATLRFDAGAANNRIQALLSDGFEVGNNNDVNGNNRTYHYFALVDGGP